MFSEEHDIIQAYSGTEGELLFQSQQIDLVLLDIMLPGKGGEEVLKFIRQRSSVPVIMLTALGDKHLISQYLLDGANDYIVKPLILKKFMRVSPFNYVNTSREVVRLRTFIKLKTSR